MNRRGRACVVSAALSGLLLLGCGGANLDGAIASATGHVAARSRALGGRVFDPAGIRDASTGDCHLDGERTLTTNSVPLRVWNVRSLSWEWPDREGATGRSATPVPRIAPSVIELPAKHGPDGPLQTIAAA